MKYCGSFSKIFLYFFTQSATSWIPSNNEILGSEDYGRIYNAGVEEATSIRDVVFEVSKVLEIDFNNFYLYVSLIFRLSSSIFMKFWVRFPWLHVLVIRNEMSQERSHPGRKSTWDPARVESQE